MDFPPPPPLSEPHYSHVKLDRGTEVLPVLLKLYRKGMGRATRTREEVKKKKTRNGSMTNGRADDLTLKNHYAVVLRSARLNQKQVSQGIGW